MINPAFLHTTEKTVEKISDGAAFTFKKSIFSTISELTEKMKSGFQYEK